MADGSDPSVQVTELTRLNSKLKGADQTVPHYLRPPSGSCHDVCKYGKPHVFVTKPKRLVRRKPGSEIPIQIFIPENKTRFNESKPKAAADSPSSVLVSSNRENPVPIKSSIKQGGASSLDAVRSHSPSIKQKAGLPPRHALSKSEESSVKKREVDVPVPSRRKSCPSSASTIKAADREKVVRFPYQSSAGSTSVSSKSRPGNVKLSPPVNAAMRLSLKGVSAARSNESNPRILKNDITTEKSLASSAVASSSPSRPGKIQQHLLGKQTLASSIKSIVKAPMRRNRVSNIGKTSKRKDEDTPEAQTSTEYSVAMEPGYEKVTEKTLHVIKEDTPSRLYRPRAVSSIGYRKSVSQSFSSSNSSGTNPDIEPAVDSKSMDSSISVADNDNDSNASIIEDAENQVKPRISKNHEHSGGTQTKLELIRANKKKAVQLHTNAAVSPRRLSFRRRASIDQQVSNGSAQTKLKPTRINKKAAVELQTSTPVSPRRLSFRRRAATTTLGTDQPVSGGLIRGMSIKRRVKIGKSTDLNPVCEKVVLRHLGDIQGKKSDHLGLLNEVIEETASRLVEVRKSRVKALVGAFETVIGSLQDGVRSSWEKCSSSHSSRGK